MLRKELAEQRELLHTRKARRKGKRVALKGKFVFSTQEVLEIATAAKEETKEKKGRKQPRAPLISTEFGSIEEGMLKTVYSDSESNCIVIAPKKLI